MNFTMKSRVMPNKSNMNIIDKNKFIHFDHEFYKRTYTDLVYEFYNEIKINYKILHN